jgi:hypothetical protein
MAYNNSPTLQNSTVEYNNSPHLQTSTVDYSPSLQPSTTSTQDGSTYAINPTEKSIDNTQYIVNDPNNPPVVYAVGPDGNPDLNNPIVYTVADNSTPAMGAPAMTYNAAPAPAQFRMTKEVYIAIAAIIIAIIGGILLGVSKSTAENCLLDCYETSYSYYSSHSYTDCYKKCKSQYDAMRGSGIALLVIGAIVLLGDGGYWYNQVMQQQMQMQQQQMQQMQVQM